MAFDAGRSGDAAFPIVIVGTGFAGLGMGIALKKAGIESFTILERAQSVGGTWRDNHYPGCACDVQSHLYSFSFEPNPDWTRMFAQQPEIKAYLERCAEKYGLLPHIRFGAEVVQARYDETARLWTVTTRDGRSFPARVLISGMGGLSTPAYPDLPGLDRFKGKAFHSAEWDHAYDLTDKRVAVIGTGASAIQFVPQIQRQVARLDVYQRTPPWIMPKPDRPIGAFERSLYRRFPILQRLYRSFIYWLLETRVLGFVIDPRIMKLAARVSLAHLKRQVRDPELRRKLTPDYTFGCKRVLISDDYYPALTQPNVALITTAIREVREHGIVTADGVEHPTDCIIFGTGFKAQDPLPRGTIFGRGGIDLLDAWKEGPEAYKGTTIAGFPNLFMIVGPNTGLGHSSMVYMIESQVAYILDAIRQMRTQGWSAVEVKPERQARYNADLQRRLQRAIWTAGGCRSWYLNDQGRNTTLWPGFTFRFRQLLARFDADDYLVEPLTVAVNADVV
ncbi:Predicted flavoprotein CzcO associated with the cation diffusion facilitator CzcD [Fontimonas thermophila]|uniref:Predicted flavoprotein CzcO associated with the cation diffusion facilitator CzcD n=1 Tax=Fontimonas thermophila TaxID=1076937 RepID=A0A1I2HQZ5_9GAMM|nr:NAD(P)/FAD-dependent oxidoreductase [Fontimonas thermophila]SFF32725.1 Predicted flavoprotein CzcO associated with the cation diffusion facilitator CzcD [Fontimonas thermophila]